MSTFGKAYLVISTVVAVILFVLLMLRNDIPSETATAFLGVILGAIISGVIQYATSDAALKQQLKLAALDKRLQAAQDAYTSWLTLYRLPSPDEDDGTDIVEVLRKSRDWWNANSLFLSREARDAFYRAWKAADNLAIYRSSHADAKDIIEARAEIDRAGEIIVKSVFLPAIGELK
jgi:hypothetical protein